MMVAIWRMLFQGVTDRDALADETWYHAHNRFAHPTVHRVIRRFQPELFLPFVRDPALLDDDEAVDQLERSYFQNQPLLSGRQGTTRGPLTAGVGKVALIEGIAPPIPMATYGPMPGMAKGVREPVFARAIVFDNGARRLALVSCDLMIMDLRIRKKVMDLARSRGFDLDDILLTATHTHTSIGGYVDHWLAEFYIMGSFRADVRSHLVERIVDAIALAVDDRRAAKARGRPGRRCAATIAIAAWVLLLTPRSESSRSLRNPARRSRFSSTSPDIPSSIPPTVAFRRTILASSHGLSTNATASDCSSRAPSAI